MTEQTFDPNSGSAATTETAHYADGTSVTGPRPLPDTSPGGAARVQSPEDAQAQQNQVQADQRAQEAESAARGEPPAARTDPNEEATGPGGQSLGGRREIAGGAITRELAPPPPTDQRIDDLYFHRRYIGSRLAREAGHLIARSPENIGLWGKGHTYRGNGGILVNIDTLEKVRVQDGYRFEGDEVYANSRDLPPSLVTGDVAQNLSGEAAQQMAEQRA